MKILVSGGAGYIGSVLCEHLLDAGHGVTVLDSLIWGQTPLFHLCHNKNFDFVFGDCRDDAILVNLIQEVDAIIPLAAIVGAPACQMNPWQAWQVNLDAVRMINAIRSPRQLVIFPTTNSGYGTRSGETFCTEETPLEPISLYGQTKVNAEKTLLDSQNTIVLRLATVFGMSPRMRLDLLVNDFTWQAVTNKSLNIFEKDFKRNYVHIRDVADCFVWCLDNSEKLVGNAFNLGLDSANLSKEELALLVQEHVDGFEIRYSEFGKDPDKRNYVVSNEKLKKAGFEAKRSVEDGILELIKGFKLFSGIKKPFQNA